MTDEKSPEQSAEQPELNETHDAEWFHQRGIEDERVIEALNAVPRRPFMQLGDEDSAISVTPLPPVEVAGKLLMALELSKESKVLEIGTETGYLSALLANICDQVFTVERRLPLAKLAEGRLKELGVEGVEILYGPRLTEYALNAPYDAILLSAVAPRVPTKLKSRLAIDGRLVVPVAEGARNPELIVIRRVSETTFERQSLGQLRFTSKLGDILVELGVAGRTDIELAAMEADASGQRLGEALIEHAQIQERDLIRALALQRGFQLNSVDTLLKIADHELAYSVPRAFLEHHQILPLVVREGSLSVATVDPDAPAVELARILDATDVEVFLVTTEDFRRLWNTLLEGRKKPAQEDTLKSRVEAKFESLLRAATRVQASTIHLDNNPEGGRVRFRMGGELREIPEFKLAPTEITYLVEFIKREAHLDVLEQRLPQRGRLAWVREPVTYQMNIQIMPSITGEQLTLQLLSMGTEPATLSQLGFPDDITVALFELLQQRRGLFLIVGPRHVGKTETLYALVRELARDSRLKVATLEDEVLCPLSGVHQALVQPDQGFGFQEAIYEFARFDVDVLGVGDLPNPDTVLEALNVARRGMLMICVLHGKNALHVVRGLREFGLPADALAAGITGILTQRRAPMICLDCREPSIPDPAQVEKLFPAGPPMGFKAYRGAGCKACGNTGIRGSIPVLELLPFNESMRKGVRDDETEEELRWRALEQEMETISQYAVRLVQEGKIPLEELSGYIPVGR